MAKGRDGGGACTSLWEEVRAAARGLLRRQCRCRAELLEMCSAASLRPSAAQPSPGQRCPQLPAQAQRAQRAPCRPRAGCWKRGPVAGRKAPGVRFPPLWEVSKGGLFSPLAVHQKKGAGKEEDKLAEGLGRVAGGPRLDIAERSRGAAGNQCGTLGGQRDPQSQCNIFYIYLFFKVSVKEAGLFVVRSFQPDAQSHASRRGCSRRWQMDLACFPACVATGPNCSPKGSSQLRALSYKRANTMCLFVCLSYYLIFDESRCFPARKLTVGRETRSRRSPP